ncbi:MAG: complex I NDUFA9 subunit family protein [Erythrobacter sp.]|nr:complex I NDUFA9 subunit family protein [Erythrobacter sp.]
MARKSPLHGKLVTLIGGNGFIGKYVAQALLERGARVRIAARHPETAYKLKPLANLGQLQFARCDVLDPASVGAAVAGADAVVNCAGSFAGDQRRLMGEAPGVVARAASAAGAGAYVELGSIGADPDSPALFGRAKALGEANVLAAFPTATVLRPSVVFGEDDRFITMFAGVIQAFPVLPVFGPEAKLQLVCVDDVAEAVAVALEDPATHGGKTYELGGPEVLTMLDIHQRIADAQHRSRTFVPVPDALTAVFAALPLTPMTSDQWLMLKAGSVVGQGMPGLDKLGIAAKPLGLFLDRWMVRYREHGRFGAKRPAA